MKVRIMVAGLVALLAAAIAFWSLDSSGKTSAAAAGSKRSAAAAAANLWVDTNGGRCTRSSSPTAYSDSAACSSLAAAYNAAQGGDIVYVRAGSYPSDTIAFRSIGTSVVTMAREPGGGPVTFAGIESTASYVTFEGLDAGPDPGGYSITCKTCAYPNIGEASHVTVENFTTPFIHIRAQDVIIHRGTVGPHNPCSGGTEDGIVVSGVGTLGGPFAPSDHVTIDDVAIHDIIDPTGNCGHIDCIQSFSASFLTIKNSRLWNCGNEVYVGYSFDTHDPSQIDNVLIENNTVGNPTNGYLGLSMGSDAHDCGHTSIVVQNNTFYGGVDAEISCGLRPTVIFRNNVVLGSETCLNYAQNEEWAYDYNVFANPGTGCATTPHAKICMPTFVDPSHTNGNADIVTGDKCAGSAADPRQFALTDAHGRPRIAPDVGANAVTPLPSRTRVLGVKSKASGCQSRGPLPDRRCSPGAIYTDATVPIVCRKDYSVLIGKPSTQATRAVYAGYGVTRRQAGTSYKIDHIVPLELGGSNDAANLFPQGAANSSPGFQAKNALEARLHELVCAGQAKLAPTQLAIARDWVSLYRKVFGRKP